MLAEAKACHSGKIDALITLLGDDDRKVRSLARRHLNKMGYPFCDLYLAPVQPRDIFARMIRNLTLLYLQTDQKKKVDILERIFSDFVTK